MGVASTNIIAYKLVASGSILDLYDDEDILVSDNITGLFDVGVIPSDFSRTIMLPATKKNNAFFQHAYDISIVNPYLFATNVKVPAYLDMDGIYLANGYIQLNKVIVQEGLGVLSYEVSLYGTVSSFARDMNRTFLTDLTSLRSLNHTASFNNITASWNNSLFNGDIVYPMAEYGQKLQYSPEEPYYGLDSPSGSISVQDFKPAIRVKKVWDAIFDEFGFTYSGSFMQSDFLNSVYMLCNNNLKYIQISGSYYGTSSINLETYGLFRNAPFSGSGQTNVTMSVSGQDYPLNWANVQYNPQNNMSGDLVYTLPTNTRLKGNINLNFELKPNTATSIGYPQFNLLAINQSTAATTTIPLQIINNYMVDQYNYNLPYNKQEKFTLLSEFVSPFMDSGSYKFSLETVSNLGGALQYSVVLDPNNEPKSYLEVTKLINAGEGKIVDIPTNMPYGTSGIKLIDFLKGMQKKFNLIIYPDKTTLNQFVVETFNRWYNSGEVRDFNRYINIKEPIEVIPANTLAVNELNFGDKLDTDYVSQQFAKAANREYGKSYYIDTNNFFSQGQFNVETTFASAPLLYLTGTGNSGSAVLDQNYQITATFTGGGQQNIICLGGSYTNTTNQITANLYDLSGNAITNYGSDIIVVVRMDFSPCYGGSFTQDLPITIPYGSNVGTTNFDEVAYVDCGQGSCQPETYNTNTACIVAIYGGTGIGAVKSNSSIQSC